MPLQKTIVNNQYMKLKVATLLLLLSSVFCENFLLAQTIPKEELIFLTSEWKGERFAD
jgi:hypothetical protein